MSFKELFLLICFAQSLLLAVVLFSYSKNKIANRLLALQILIWGTMCYYRYTVFQDAHYILLHHWILKWNNVIFLTFFVFPFLYVKYMSSGTEKFKKKDWFHFFPAFLAGIALIPFFILSGEEKIALMTSSPTAYFKTVHLLIDNIAVVQGIVYVALSLKYINLYHNRIKEDYSNIDHLTLYWLRNLFLLISVIWFLGTVGSNLYAFNLVKDYYFDFHFFLVGSSIYIISYYLFTKNELFITDRFIEEFVPYPIDEERVSTLEKATEEEKKDIQLSEEYCEEIIRRLIKAMETDKMYLNQNLSLNKVAQAISIPRYHISLVLNKKLNNTFFDYINKYRVEEVKRMIQSPQADKLTLLGIAFEAGFNSKATFNRSFKKYESVTPQQYRALICK